MTYHVISYGMILIVICFSGTIVPVSFRRFLLCLSQWEGKAMVSILQKTIFISARSFRRPMLVRELMVFPAMRQEISFYVCPRCRRTVEREFMCYCDRCGQCLNWARYEQAEIVYPGGEKMRGGAKRSASAVKSMVRFIFNAGR